MSFTKTVSILDVFSMQKITTLKLTGLIFSQHRLNMVSFFPEFCMGGEYNMGDFKIKCQGILINN